MILAKYVSSLQVKCIKIQVKGSSFDVSVQHVYSLMSVSFNDEQMFLSKLKSKYDDVFSLIVYWQMW